MDSIEGAGADFRREFPDEVFGFEAGRGGLKAGALRLMEGLEDSDMVKSSSKLICRP